MSDDTKGVCCFPCTTVKLSIILHPAKSSKRSLPSKKVIKEEWAKYLICAGKFDSLDELFEGDYCFACGQSAKTERCHIVARQISNCDHEGNLHLLCRRCHKESEMIDDISTYFEWFEAMNLLVRMCGGLEAWQKGQQGIAAFERDFTWQRKGVSQRERK